MKILDYNFKSNIFAGILHFRENFYYIFKKLNDALMESKFNKIKFTVQACFTEKIAR